MEENFLQLKSQHFIVKVIAKYQLMGGKYTQGPEISESHNKREKKREKCINREKVASQ